MRIVKAMVGKSLPIDLDHAWLYGDLAPATKKSCTALVVALTLFSEDSPIKGDGSLRP